jgi:stage II sporulation protein P
MDRQGNHIRLGITMILMALILRLGSAGFFQPVADFITGQGLYKALFFLETGRSIPDSQEVSVFFGESAPPVTAASLPVFSPQDLDSIDLTNTSGLEPDLEGLLCTSLDWDLFGQEPTVLILHTHTTESYTKTSETYAETSAYRTLEEGYNMLSIGDLVADKLSQQGIAVIHDRTFHDYPSYNGSYTRARETISGYLDQYPSIRLVLDLHRDASGEGRNQMRPVTKVAGKSCAQLMLVLGTNMDTWQDNLSLALKLQAQLEKLAPGITRPLQLRPQRFNQDLCPGALLIEVGAAGNTHSEALLAADYLAQTLIFLAKGTQEAP